MNNFDEIRCYTDAEAKELFPKIIKDPEFLSTLKFMAINDEQFEYAKSRFLKYQDIYDLQTDIINLLIQNNIDTTTKGLTIKGVENFDNWKPTVFISNHRDILLDPAYIQYVLRKSGIKNSEIAIGNNLLIRPWITHFVKMNRSFIVKRDVPIRQMLNESSLLSSYIHHALNEKLSNIWIAQKEGRTKNGYDKTQLSVLKMLCLSSSKPTVETFKDLNIVPFTFSYELNPCDGYFAYENYIKQQDPNFKKSPIDDINSMREGVLGQKGRVCIHFGKPLNSIINQIEHETERNKVIEFVAKYIDNQIYSNYEIYNFNYLAYDLKHNQSRFADKYTSSDKNNFESYIKLQNAKYNINSEFFKNFIIASYSKPLENKLLQ